MHKSEHVIIGVDPHKLSATIEVVDNHRPHTAARDQAPASRLKTGVTNVMSNYT